MKGFHYVYIPFSEADEERPYAGLTEDLASRVRARNNGQVRHTSRYRPWQVETAVAVRSHEKAAKFERYLKSHSGRAFAGKHF